jgi:hypothetical protein
MAGTTINQISIVSSRELLSLLEETEEHLDINAPQSEIDLLAIGMRWTECEELLSSEAVSKISPDIKPHNRVFTTNVHGMEHLRLSHSHCIVG